MSTKQHQFNENRKDGRFLQPHFRTGFQSDT